MQLTQVLLTALSEYFQTMVNQKFLKLLHELLPEIIPQNLVAMIRWRQLLYISWQKILKFLKTYLLNKPHLDSLSQGDTYKQRQLLCMQFISNLLATCISLVTIVKKVHATSTQHFPEVQKIILLLYTVYAYAYGYTIACTSMYQCVLPWCVLQCVLVYAIVCTGVTCTGEAIYSQNDRCIL